MGKNRYSIRFGKMRRLAVISLITAGVFLSAFAQIAFAFELRRISRAQAASALRPLSLAEQDNGSVGDEQRFRNIIYWLAERLYERTGRSHSELGPLAKELVTLTVEFIQRYKARPDDEYLELMTQWNRILDQRKQLNISAFFGEGKKYCIETLERVQKAVAAERGPATIELVDRELQEMVDVAIGDLVRWFCGCEVRRMIVTDITSHLFIYRYITHGGGPQVEMDVASTLRNLFPTLNYFFVGDMDPSSLDVLQGYIFKYDSAMDRNSLSQLRRELFGLVVARNHPVLQEEVRVALSETDIVIVSLRQMVNELIKPPASVRVELQGILDEISCACEDSAVDVVKANEEINNIRRRLAMMEMCRDPEYAEVASECRGRLATVEEKLPGGKEKAIGRIQEELRIYARRAIRYEEVGEWSVLDLLNISKALRTRSRRTLSSLKEEANGKLESAWGMFYEMFIDVIDLRERLLSLGEQESLLALGIINTRLEERHNLAREGNIEGLGRRLTTYEGIAYLDNACRRIGTALREQDFAGFIDARRRIVAPPFSADKTLRGEDDHMYRQEILARYLPEWDGKAAGLFSDNSAIREIREGEHNPNRTFTVVIESITRKGGYRIIVNYNGVIGELDTWDLPRRFRPAVGMKLQATIKSCVWNGIIPTPEFSFPRGETVPEELRRLAEQGTPVDIQIIGTPINEETGKIAGLQASWTAADGTKVTHFIPPPFIPQYMFKKGLDHFLRDVVKAVPVYNTKPRTGERVLTFDIVRAEEQERESQEARSRPAARAKPDAQPSRRKLIDAEVDETIGKVTVSPGRPTEVKSARPTRIKGISSGGRRIAKKEARLAEGLAGHKPTLPQAVAERPQERKLIRVEGVDSITGRAASFDSGKRNIVVFEADEAFLVPQWQEACARMIAPYSGSADSKKAITWARKEVSKMNWGKGLDSAVKDLVKILGKTKPAEEERVKRELMRVVPLEIIRGAGESFIKLRDAGVDIVVVSAAERPVIVRQVKEAVLGGLIPEEQIAGEDDLSILERFKGAKILYFGRRPVCLELAKDSGAIVNGILSGATDQEKDQNWTGLQNAGVDYIIDDWNAALRWLGALVSAAAPKPRSGVITNSSALLTGV